MLKWLLLLVLAAAFLWYLARPRARAGTCMATTEALAILGLGAGASADDIRAAHRRLIAQVHPDAGGSAALATRVNAARDTALAALDPETSR
jgi:preprotein translocase subunit Sec63